MIEKLIYIISLLLTTYIFQSCNSKSGSGNVLTEWRDIREFEQLSISNAKLVTITQGDKCALKITADDNVINKIIAKNSNKRLIIGTKKNIHDTDIELDITTKTLNNLEFDGRAEVNLKGEFLAHNLELKNNGNGKLEIEKIISDQKVKIVLNGAGTANVNGKSRVLLLKTSGSGSIFADNFEADTIGIKIQGSGNVFIKTDKVLIVRIMGSGNVIYSGNPVTLEKHISGSGTITKK